MLKTATTILKENFFTIFRHILSYQMTKLALEFIYLNISFICGRMYNKYFWKKVKSNWIVITGCTDGIGKEIALQLSQQNYKLCLLARNQDKLTELTNQIKKSEFTKSEIKEIIFDFKNEVPENLFDDLEEISLLINNAGISSDFPNYFEESNVLQILTTNVLTTSVLTKLAMKKMKKGSIIFVSSILAENTAPLLACYSASKAFVKHLSQSLYFEKKHHSEVIFPGYVCSKMSKIRKESFFVPSASRFASSVIKTIGFSCVTVPYYPHLLINFVYKNVFSGLFGTVFLRKLLVVRNIALKKKKQN